MKYGEIINHPHYEPRRHPRMSREMRAAQFAPYAALHGQYRSRRIIEVNPDEAGETFKGGEF